MRLFKRWLFAAVLATGAATAIAAQPPYPVPIPQPIPAPVPRPSMFDGRWFFRGDPNKPCYVQTVSGPSGPALLFTNENGSQAYGYPNRSGGRVTIPDWNLTGTLRGDALVWPNGDFWHR